jgi:hypothetical protein
MLKRLLATATFAAVIAVTGQAGAVLINSASYTAAGCLGAANCVIGSATLTAGPANATFDEQNFGGAQGLGISFINTGQPRDPEIQGDKGSVEQVAISFGTPQIVNEIDLAQFYNPVHFGPSEPNEIAQIFNGLVLATLQVFDDSGTHLALGFDPGATFAQLDTTAGLWQILNPFGNTPISGLVFTAADTPTTTDNSDYSIALLQTSAVPEPSTLSLIGLGLLGVGALRRWRRKGAALALGQS